MAASAWNPKPLPTGIGASELESLAEEYGTPLYIYDEGRIVAGAKNLTARFSAAGFEAVTRTSCAKRQQAIAEMAVTLY